MCRIKENILSRMTVKETQREIKRLWSTFHPNCVRYEEFSFEIRKVCLLGYNSFLPRIKLSFSAAEPNGCVIKAEIRLRPAVQIIVSVIVMTALCVQAALIGSWMKGLLIGNVMILLPCFFALVLYVMCCVGIWASSRQFLKGLRETVC